MDKGAIRSALVVAHTVLDTTTYNATDAFYAVRRLAALAPRHVEPIARMAEQAILKAIKRPGISYDALASTAMDRLVTEMERDLGGDSASRTQRSRNASSRPATI